MSVRRAASPPGACRWAGRLAGWVVVGALATACAPDTAPPGATEPATTVPPTAVPAGAAATAPEVSTADWPCDAVCLRWRAVLRRLDRDRARAYERGRPGLLRRVYAHGSQVLARDRRQLRSWARREATLSGVRLRVLSVRELPSGPHEVRLRVVEQLGAAVATLPGGDVVRLPRDRPTERVLVLRWQPGGWRITAAHHTAHHPAGP